MRPSARCLGWTYASTIFLSALLLFEVQPVVSKFILPWFGGSPAVWTTCMLFFQTVLFAGYAYAHCSERLLNPRWQAVVHLALIVAALAVLPITPDVGWKPQADDAPTWRILCLLAASVGLPYFLLSTTGPLVQAWFSRSFPGRSPYRLYALSNIGSLLALLSYPFYVEPTFDVIRQTHLWAYGFVAFALLCGYGAVTAARIPRLGTEQPNDPDKSLAEPEVPTAGRRALWLALPGFASLMLLATTNHVCQDVAVMPFLWVVPLSLYLLSFIICFDHERWYMPQVYGLAALVTLCLAAGMDQLITGGAGIAFSFTQELAIHFAALFCVCMLCHGELVRLRPDPRYLTSFYLMISAGGALGGIFVSLIAPAIFSTFFEWKIGLVGGCLLAALVVLGGQEHSRVRRRLVLATPAMLLAFIGLNCVPQLRAGRAHELYQAARNFYGVVSVVERNIEEPRQHKFNFYSGRIVHGLQFVDARKRSEPTAYFGPATGVGQAFASLHSKQNLHVGVVGLGVGTLAVYARPGDRFRFYEINDEVLRMAEKHFSYLKDCRGKVEVVLGDGRLSLEREAPQQFDLLVLDAFSGDAVPTHLLTKEAFEIYLRHLKPASEIAVNISNRYLDLEPVVFSLADYFKYDARHISSAGDPVNGRFPAEWIVLTPRRSTALADKSASPSSEPLWTDSHSNLFEILK